MLSTCLVRNILSMDRAYCLDLLGVLRFESSSADENSSEESTERRMKSSSQLIHPTLTARALLCSWTWFYFRVLDIGRECISWFAIFLNENLAQHSSGGMGMV